MSLSHTSQDSFYKWTKILSLEINIFQLKDDDEKWSRSYFEIDRATSEIPANLPGQFSPNVQIFWHWAAATLKGLSEFQNEKFQAPFFIILRQKCKFQDSIFQSTYRMSPSWCVLFYFKSSVFLDRQLINGLFSVNCLTVNCCYLFFPTDYFL